jgi:hypothetical protein
MTIVFKSKISRHEAQACLLTSGYHLKANFNDVIARRLYWSAGVLEIITVTETGVCVSSRETSIVDAVDWIMDYEESLQVLLDD